MDVMNSAARSSRYHEHHVELYHGKHNHQGLGNRLLQSAGVLTDNSHPNRTARVPRRHAQFPSLHRRIIKENLAAVFPFITASWLYSCATAAIASSCLTHFGRKHPMAPQTSNNSKYGIKLTRPPMTYSAWRTQRIDHLTIIHQVGNSPLQGRRQINYAP
jgi:hypothetical protein